ncbi:MAG TPA: DUF6542 domain-containing protein [Pseudonocardiaceae bacterium]
MTTTRDRGREARATSSGPRWDERSAFGSRGWPWWAAVVLALGLSIVGAVIDEKSNSNIATIFRAAYVIGCVAAVCMVRRRNLFGPMVQPPLILVVVVPLVAAALDDKPGSKVLVIGPQLINNFPVMAITTGVTVVLGVIRYLVQRRPVDDDFDADRPRRSESRSESRDRDRGPSGRDRDLDDRPSAGSRGSRPPAGRSGQDRTPPRDRARVDPSRNRAGSDRDRGADRGQSSSREPRDRARDPRDREPRDRDPRGDQPRGRSPRDRDPRREPRRRNDDY